MVNQGTGVDVSFQPEPMSFGDSRNSEYPQPGQQGPASPERAVPTDYVHSLAHSSALEDSMSKRNSPDVPLIEIAIKESEETPV